MMWFLLPLFIIFIILYFHLTRNFNYWKKRNVPYAKPVLLFGNILDVIKQKRQLVEMFKSLYQSTTSPYIGFFVFDQPFLLIRDLDLIKRMIITDFDYFTDRTAVTCKKDSIGSKILFLLKGDAWKELRKSTTSLFSLNKLKNMVPLINEIGNNLVQHVDSNLDKDSIDCRSVSLKFGIDVISSCAFGFEANALLNNDSIFVQATLKLFEVTFIRGIHLVSCFFGPMLVNLFNFTFSDVNATNTLRNIFNKVCKERKESGKNRGDLIDILNNIKMQDGTVLNDEYSAGLAIQMLLAGHETTGTVISFLVYELCCHIDVQNRLREEVQNVLKANHGDMSYKTINEMTYLDMVALRKYPVLGFLDRRCVKPYKVPGTDLIIEKGIPVYIPVLALHYDDRFYKNPEKFDPERFSPINKSSRATCAYMPFGEGMRYCIGNQMALITMKIFVTKIILHFKVEPSKDTPKSIIFEPKTTILVPQNGELRVKFTRI